MYRLIVTLSLLALLAIQLSWHLLLPEAIGTASWIWLLIGATPVLACLLALWLDRASALFWSGVLALLYFCHGVMEGWSLSGTASAVAWLEAVVSVALVLAVGAEGLARRRAQRAATSTPAL